jgi:hypothetical protein
MQAFVEDRGVKGLICLEESFLESCRRRVEEQYRDIRLGSGAVGGCFGSILCYELHYGNEYGGLHFSALAAKWGIPVTVLGDLIADHCRRLEPLLTVNHDCS